MAEMPVVAIVAALFCATTAVGLVRVQSCSWSCQCGGRALLEANRDSRCPSNTREALIVKEAEVEALVRENQGIAPDCKRLRPR